MHVADYLSDMFDNGNPYDINYFDFEKADDRISHIGLANNCMA